MSLIELCRKPNSLFSTRKQQDSAAPDIIELSIVLNIIFMTLESNRNVPEAAEIVVESGIVQTLMEILTEQADVSVVVESVPIKKLLLVFHKALSVGFEEFFSEEKLQHKAKFYDCEPTTELKVREDQLLEHKEVLSSFKYNVPGAIQEAENLLRGSFHQSYPGIFQTFSEEDSEEKDSIFFSRFHVFVASLFGREEILATNLLRLLYAAAPNPSTSQEDSLHISEELSCWGRKLQCYFRGNNNKSCIQVLFLLGNYRKWWNWNGIRTLYLNQYLESC